jgi:cell pole-organizing protein PopZ
MVHQSDPLFFLLESLNPKLEQWIENNLPQIVKDIVREEIQKILPKK